MAITGTFLANFEQFNREVDGAGVKLRTFEGTSARASTAIATMGTTAETSTGLLGGMGAQLAGLFTLGAIVAFGNTVLDAGDKIMKMADQTGLGIDQIQKLQYIAGQSGSSVESLVGAVQNLQLRLGDESSGAAGAVGKLGINMAAFTKLDSYAQLTAVAEAVKGIQNPTEQVTLAAAVFGKTWKEILPAIKSGMQEVGDEAPIMADETVKSLDRVGDAMTRAKQQATAWGGATVLALEGAGFAVGDYLSRFNPEHWGVSTSEILAQQKALNDPDGLLDAMMMIPTAVAPAVAAIDSLGNTAGQTRLAEMDLTASAEALIVVNKKLAAEQEAAWKVTDQSLTETTALWTEHFRTIRDETATTAEKQHSAVQDWFDDEVTKLKDSDANWELHYSALAAVAKDRHAAVDAALARTAQASDDCTDQARTGFQQWNDDVMNVTRSLDGTILNTEKLIEAQLKLRAMGNSITYDLSTQGGVDTFRKMNPGMDIAMSDTQLIAFAKAGGTLQELMQQGIIHMRGFEGGGPTGAGGLAMTHPGEYVVPKGGALVLSGGGGSITNHFYLVDNTETLARKVADTILRQQLRRGPI